ncbi:MAG: rRNA pseudouridine synthase [Alphaproteobacteria bacterium]|nr:rRNA pseudouridine synthase [Alphaproteobacteria bacterium]
MKQRIAKFIASSGIASRRDAEKIIASGAVSVNGVVITTPATIVDNDVDTVMVNGKKIEPQSNTELYIFNKPLNVMTTARDPNARTTIYDILPDEYKHLRYVGRLDYKTTGLLLLTNDGDLVQKLSLPSNKIPRTYIARVGGTKHQFEIARRGATVDGIKYRPMEIDEIGKNKLRITVTEGKKNEIRIVLRACGAPVQKLHRESFGNLHIGNLESGKIKKVHQKDVDLLLKTL